MTVGYPGLTPGKMGQLKEPEAMVKNGKKKKKKGKQRAIRDRRRSQSGADHSSTTRIEGEGRSI